MDKYKGKFLSAMVSAGFNLLGISLGLDVSIAPGVWKSPIKVESGLFGFGPYKITLAIPLVCSVSLNYGFADSEDKE